MLLNVMTYNIRLGIDSCLADLADAIRNVGTPDLLAIQEIGVNWRMGECVDQPRVLAEALGLQHVFAGALTDQNGGRYGIALMSPYEITQTRTTNLKQIEDEQRVLLKAQIEAPRPFTVLTSHFSICEEERRIQAAHLSALGRQCEGPVIALGDFNAEPDSVEYGSFEGAFTDCFAVRGTGHPETYSVKDPYLRIDYILTAGDARPAGTCRVERSVRTSDHFPLVAQVEIGDAQHPTSK